MDVSTGSTTRGESTVCLLLPQLLHYPERINMCAAPKTPSFLPASLLTLGSVNSEIQQDNCHSK